MKGNRIKKLEVDGKNYTLHTAAGGTQLTEDQVARINEKTLSKHMEKVDEEFLSKSQLDTKCPDEASKFAVLHALRVNKKLSCKMQPGAEYSEEELEVIRDQINNDVSKEMIAEGMEVLIEGEW